jgi:exopolysaccharide biosynthesis protein
LLLALGLISFPLTPAESWTETRMAESGPLSVVNVIVARLDPRRVHLRLDTATVDYGLTAAWTIDRIPAHGLAAFNAGQFIGGFPWGWLVMNGVEQQRPGTGSLAMAFAVDHSGTARLLTPDELPEARGKVAFAFQSYPMLLTGHGELPWELQAAGRGVSLTHRDSRLALGLRADGSVVVALTRFTGAGTIGERLPWGPTILEMADFMRSQGCVRAMMLDGGLSSQLAVRHAGGGLERWANWRAVPLAVVAVARH